MIILPLPGSQITDIISCSFVVVTEIFKLKTIKYFAFYVYQTSVF